MIFVLFCIILSTLSSVGGNLYLEILIDDYITPLVGAENPVFTGLIKAIGNDTLSVKEIMERLNLKGDDNFRKVYLNPAIEEGYVLRTEENKLRSPNQKYYLSDKGKALL